MNEQPREVTLYDLVHCLTGAKAVASLLAEQLLPTEPKKAHLVKSLGEEVGNVWTKYAPLLVPRPDKS